MALSLGCLVLGVACGTSSEAGPDAGDASIRDGGEPPSPPSATGSKDDPASSADDPAPQDSDSDSDSDGPPAGPTLDTEGLPAACEGLGQQIAPKDLACTGLYADVAGKKLAAGAQSFKPAVELWSDGAKKHRWLLLPEGKKIDASDPDDWKFPTGTKLFKEFQWKGQRVETRMFWKVSESRWLKAAYHWSSDESQAERFPGGDVSVAGDTYYIPSAKECDQCHKGRTDRALGFEAVLLGLEGAEGMTLADLVEAKMLSKGPGTTRLTVGDDGTGQGAEALAWLHVNCGVSCHNQNPASEAYLTDLSLRLRVEDVDGSSTANVDAITSTVGVEAVTRRWAGQTRIVPGAPERSLLYDLARERDARDPDDQMPPIASRVADPEGIPLLRAWISAL